MNPYDHLRPMLASREFEPGLRRLRELAAAGFSANDVRDALRRLMDEADASADEEAWDRLADLVDVTYGHCAPEIRVWPFDPNDA